MTTKTIPVSRSVDRTRAISALVTAFSSDPVIRWFYPDASGYLTHFPAAVQLFGGPAFDTGNACCTENHTGTALWVPPNATIDEAALVSLLEQSIDATRHNDIFTILEEMGRHHPSEAHWYLPFIGVDPSRHCQGYGSAMLQDGLARCDQDALPAYLEASSPRNRALYERHGFEVIGEIQVGDCPPMWPMWRAPR
jgi:ribosomal protein S18 acetylase RimI-like enzyme